MHKELTKYDEGWLKLYKRMESANTHRPGGYSVMNPGFYKRQLESLASLIELNDMDILELGGGIGGLAKMIIEKYPDVKSYTMIDHNTMLKFAKDNLVTEKVSFIDVDNIKDISDTYDLFVSVHCLTETPIEYQEYVYGKLFPLCKQVFIIDGDKIEGFNSRLYESLNKHFSYMEIKDWPDYPETKLFYASVLKCVKN